ncbi:DUF418 domain-containing protein [Bacillus norwichensis]|uniref:DUF418 domain-containing protein n=1 Tax=Bacillus norwichensis TaxID=2762217 RepID=A0ABR8VNX0_9BACI|nr:DUF418 domain-containing protein [Bacillus norwichensis]MBD8006467.1 DUF418 domain-containing protein [Bacillus norwichensis]
MKNRTNRVHAIDGIRGFSLLGILLANMLIFQYGLWGKDELEAFSVSAADSFFYDFLKIFVEESFIPIFTFLFGYSMIMMKESLEGKGLKVKRHFVRRSIFLLVIGWVHSSYLWEGDILFFYGLMGFFLLFFLKRKATTILVWGVLLSALWALLLIIGTIVNTDSADLVDPKKLDTYIEETKVVYGSGTYLDIMHHRNHEDPLEEEAYVLYAGLLVPFFTAPMFLFGMYAAKKKVFLDPLREQRRNRLWATCFIPLGLGFKSIGQIIPASDWAEVFSLLGGPLLSLGYIFAMAYVYGQTVGSPLLRLFENVGKLSMTNYLLQTVICTTIFYGYGLGQFGKMGVGAGIILALAIYGLQLCLSHYYLKHYRFGPIEKLNRIWMYLSLNGRPKGKKTEAKTA